MVVDVVGPTVHQVPFVVIHFENKEQLDQILAEVGVYWHGDVQRNRER